MNDVGQAAPGWRWAPAWVLAFVALWPAPGYAEGVLALGALAGLIKLVASRFRGGNQLLGGPAWALTSVLFFAYWLPEAISAIDAADRARAWREALVDLRYLPFLWIVAAAVADDAGRRRTFGGLAIIVGVWTLDALVEAATGASPLFSGIDAVKQAISGHGMCDAEQTAALDRLSGMLGPCNLKLGMVLEGVVTNVTNFGAFVDIGVHQDGLVHISALSEKFIKDPHEAVKAGDVVKVKVMEVDIPRNRIALSMRIGDTPGEKIEGPRGGQSRAGQSRGDKPAGNAPRSERHSSQDKSAPASGGMAALFANAKSLKK